MQLYKKEGKKYKKIGYSDGFNGFPREGIWIVYNKPGVKSTSCIAQVGEFEDLDYKHLARLIVERENECIRSLDTLKNKAVTKSDIVRTIFKELVRIKRK